MSLFSVFTDFPKVYTQPDQRPQEWSLKQDLLRYTPNQEVQALTR